MYLGYKSPSSFAPTVDFTLILKTRRAFYSTHAVKVKIIPLFPVLVSARRNRYGARDYRSDTEVASRTGLGIEHDATQQYMGTMHPSLPR
jgi:hypothetical protein